MLKNKFIPITMYILWLIGLFWGWKYGVKNDLTSLGIYFYLTTIATIGITIYLLLNERKYKKKNSSNYGKELLK